MLGGTLYDILAANMLTETTSQACKLLRSTIKCSVALEYELELAIAGLQEDPDVDREPITVDQRLERLKDLKSRRRRFEPILMNEFTVQPDGSSVFALNHGVYATLQSESPTE